MDKDKAFESSQSTVKYWSPPCKEGALYDQDNVSTGFPCLLVRVTVIVFICPGIAPTRRYSWFVV